MIIGELVSWLASSERINQVSAWGFLLSVIGFVLTLAGLWLTYLQARRATISAKQLQDAVNQFGFRRDRAESLPMIGEAKASMESARLLIEADSWRHAATNYDDARKAIQKARISCGGLTGKSNKSLRLICEHLTAFSNEVDAALGGKGVLPDKIKVVSAIRLNVDLLSLVQREIQEDLK